MHFAFDSLQIVKEFAADLFFRTCIQSVDQLNGSMAMRVASSTISMVRA